jgi:hypothetical protein
MTLEAIPINIIFEESLNNSNTTIPTVYPNAVFHIAAHKYRI